MIPDSLSINPEYRGPSAWWQHVPTSHWLVEKIQPKKIVELGTHYGVSFFAFCEAAAEFSKDTFIYAIDTWEGDVHAGTYNEDVFYKVEAHWSESHRQRSRLIRSTFDEALNHFPDQSIDLLHIDGLHTYEAVKHDFESWKKKLTNEAIVLFHDINVRERDFGVWKLWDELKIHYKHIEILSGHGLGILFIGSDPTNIIEAYNTSFPALQSKGDLLEELARLSPECSFGPSQLAIYQAEKEQFKAEIEQFKAEIEQLKIQMERMSTTLRKFAKPFKVMKNIFSFK